MATQIISQSVRMLIILSFSGSVAAILLFALKPLIRNRISKSAQYYMWLIVIAAFLLPLTAFITIPETLTVPVGEFIGEHIITGYEYQEREMLERTGLSTSQLTPENLEALDDDKLGSIVKALSETDRTKRVLNGLLIQVPFYGFICCLISGVTTYARFIRKLKRYNKSASENELAALTALCRAKKAPLLYRNDQVSTPMFIGLFRPSIILPDRAYTSEQLSAILQHELMHMYKKDLHIKWLAMFMCAVHWFNPIAWLVRREINRACELACDEAVIRNLDAAAKQSYGDTLISVIADSVTPHPIVPAGAGTGVMFAEKEKLKERLVAIMNFRKKTKLTVFITAVLAVVLAGSAFAFGAQGELEIGVSASNIEQDARRSQTVRELEVAKSINDNLCAMVFYDGETSDKHTFSIYVKGDGLRLGYFFRIGGSSSEIAEDYREFTFEDKGSAILSMNKNGYRQIQYDNGAGVTVIDIDPTKPFAVVLPENCFMVMLFKDNGNIVVRDSSR